MMAHTVTVHLVQSPANGDATTQHCEGRLEWHHTGPHAVVMTQIHQRLNSSLQKWKTASGSK